MAKDVPKKHPTVGPQAEINYSAMGLVATWLAKGWILQPQEPNFHEDYVIERVEAGELSGSKLSAQLKGHTTVKFNAGLWSEVMKTKHLRYYVSKAVVPVFLFVVDTTKRRGYYLFLQEWIDAHTTPTELTNQKKLTVKVPLTNNLQDQFGFLVAVKGALAYMAKKYPGSVEDAIEGETKKIAAIDPRWDVKLDVVKGNKLFTLFPKQDVSAALSVSGVEVAKLKEHFDYGKPTQLAGDGVSLKGLPLVEELTRKKGGIVSVSITPAKPRQMEMQLWTDDPNALRLTLTGEISGGHVGLAFIAALPNAPLRAEMKVSREAVKALSGEGNFSLTFDFLHWENQPIRTLPYFDKIRDFADAIVASKTIHYDLSVAGNKVTAGYLGSPRDVAPFAYAAAVVSNIDKARQIADRLQVDIRLPNIPNMQPDEFSFVDYAHSILIGGGYSVQGVGFNVKLTLLETPTPVAALQQLESLAVSGEPFSYMERAQPILIYGTSVDLGELKFSVRPITVTVPEPERSDFLAGRAKTAPAEIASVPNSTLTVTART